MDSRSTDNHIREDDIAIIGISCRFPGAANHHEFWSNLCLGKESIAHFEPDHYSEEELAAQARGKGLVRAASVIDDIDKFDAGFFAYSPREASIIDPQQRLFLEASWSALEDAGICPKSTTDRVGVFAGSGMNTYLRHMQAVGAAKGDFDGMQLAIGNDKDYLATRVSYKLNLDGPSVTVQTACSTSLVATHIACQNLLDYSCDIALAGAVSIRTPQPRHYFHVEGSILSPDGHCRVFDDNANGTVFGNGLGVVVLKRADEALKDGDDIYAVIKGSAINNDGDEKVGFTAPGVGGQYRVLRQALENADLGPETISYVEAHGTGTPLGDRIEISTLKQIYDLPSSEPCALSSVKGNIGHLDAAAGIAGLIKTCLVLKNQQVPPLMSVENANPDLDLERSRFYLPSELQQLAKSSTPSRAALSSFGIGGTNAHMILEAPPIPRRTNTARLVRLICISAKTRRQVEPAVSAIRKHLVGDDQASLESLAYTLHLGRESFDQRLFCTAASLEELDDRLKALAIEPEQAVVNTSEPQIAFIFGGQGSHPAIAMKNLYDTEPVVKYWIDHCVHIANRFSLVDVMQLIEAAANDEDSEGLQYQTENAQLLIFISAYALAKYWQSLDVSPSYFLGHSIGQYVAACLAGIMDLEAAIEIVIKRGQLMQRCSVGAMTSVFTNAESISELLDDEMEVDIAVVNTSDSCVVSGTHDAITAFEAICEAKAIVFKRLVVSHAYHSRHMHQAQVELTKFIAKFSLNAPTLPMLCNVTGDWLTDADATSPEYWGRHIRSTVQFRKNVVTLSLREPSHYLEVGADQSMQKIIAAELPEYAQKTISSLGGKKEYCDRALLDSVGLLWASGLAIKFENLYSGETINKTHLPPYPFSKQRHWLGGSKDADSLNTQSDTSLDQVKIYVDSWKRSQFKPLAANVSNEQLSFVLCSAGNSKASFKLAKYFAKYLENEGVPFVHITHGKVYEKISNFQFKVTKANYASYRSVAAALQDQCLVPTHIIYMPGIDYAEPLKKSSELALAGDLLACVNAFTSECSASPLNMSVLSNNACDVLGEEVQIPYQGMLEGLVRCLAHEYKGMNISLIDNDHAEGSSTSMHALMAEILLDHSVVDAHVAYRNGQRWVRHYEALNKAPTQSSSNPDFRQGGVYLFTGGLGGLGLALAKLLVEKYQAKVVLCSRKTWQQTRLAFEQFIQENDQSDQLNRDTLDFIECSDNVSVYSADITIHKQTCDLLKHCTSTFGQLNGVFHLAGMPGAELIRSKFDPVNYDVFKPKVVGTQVLAESLTETPLDFLILFSSITAVTGAVGQSDYCAANSFLSAFARFHQAKTKQRTLAISWDAWELDTWQSTMNQFMPEIGDELKKRRKISGIKVEQGLALIGQSLKTQLPHCIIAKQDIAELQRRSMAFSHQLFSVPEVNIVRDKKARPPLSNEYLVLETDTQIRMASIWESVLGIEGLGREDDFLELGGHSLLAVQLLGMIREDFGIDAELNLKDILERPNIAELCEYIDGIQGGSADQDLESLLEEIESMSDEEVKQKLGSGL